MNAIVFYIKQLMKKAHQSYIFVWGNGEKIGGLSQVDEEAFFKLMIVSFNIIIILVMIATAVASILVQCHGNDSTNDTLLRIEQALSTHYGDIGDKCLARERKPIDTSDIDTTLELTIFGESLK